MWVLEDALVLIRLLQPICMANGYYLALAGGVLNKGSSETDLDLVAVPRTNVSSNIHLRRILEKRLGDSFVDHVPSAVHLTFNNSGKPVEVAIVN